MSDYKGGCDCGNLSLKITTDDALLDAEPRACDCHFCVSHGAEWVSIPHASLEITVNNEAALSLYKQGSETASFWLCQHCGVVVAVTADIDDKRVGAVNRRALADADSFKPATSASPKTLSATEKKARWSELWIQSVTVKDAWE